MRHIFFGTMCFILGEDVGEKFPVHFAWYQEDNGGDGVNIKLNIFLDII